MKQIGSTIEYLVANLAGDSEQARINMRASQVRDRYREAIKTVYRDTADLFLAHTNNVYIMKKDGVSTLIVYVDDSIYSAELNAQRELIKLKLLEQFGEQIESFEIYVSRGSYRRLHPYLDDGSVGGSPASQIAPLDKAERSFVQSTVSTVEQKTVRDSLEKAMTADLGRKKAEKGKTSK